MAAGNRISQQRQVRDTHFGQVDEHSPEESFEGLKDMNTLG